MQSGSTVPYAQKHDLLPYQWTHTSILQVLARLAEDADSIGGLQERVKSLQDEMLAEDDNYWPIPSTLSEKWRYTTAESMRPFDQEVLNLRGYLVALIMEQLGIAASTVVEKQLWNMLNKSSMLAVEMSLQKYRLQVTFPNVGADYNENTMKSRQGFEGNDMECGKVAFVVNPGLTKWGDTHGDNFNYRYDIVPALVQLEPAARTHEMDTSLI